MLQGFLFSITAVFVLPALHNEQLIGITYLLIPTAP
jgi:hypothetical protein